MYNSIIVDVLHDIAYTLGGDEGVEIIKTLQDNGEIKVEEIAENTGIQINEVRKILYKFYSHSIVTSRRFRDKDTGWFIFQWRLQPRLIEAYITGMKQKILKKLQSRLEYEFQHEFYHCGILTCPRVTFEEAMDTVFHCPVCNESMKPLDNELAVVFLEKKIKEIEEELNG